MASGDTLFILKPADSVEVSANAATLGAVTEASTPGHKFRTLNYSGSADEHGDWDPTVQSNYDGGGFTFSFKYAMSGTGTGAVEMEFRSVLADDLDTLTADLGIDTATEVAVTDTPGGTANQLNYTATGNLSHANAGSPSAGDMLIIRATRDVSFATNTDDLQLVEILVTET